MAYASWFGFTTGNRSRGGRTHEATAPPRKRRPSIAAAPPFTGLVGNAFVRAERPGPCSCLRRQISTTTGATSSRAMTVPRHPDRPTAVAATQTSDDQAALIAQGRDAGQGTADRTTGRVHR